MISTRLRHSRLSALLIVAALAGGCASTPRHAPPEHPAAPAAAANALDMLGRPYRYGGEKITK